MPPLPCPALHGHHRPHQLSATGFALLAVLTVLALPVRAQVFGNALSDAAEAPIVLSNFQSDQTPRMVVAPPAEANPLASAPAPETPRLEARAIGSASLDLLPSAPPVPPHLLPFFASVAREQAVPASLLMAVAAAESGFNVRAMSPKGALGLMQLMPETARRHRVRQVWSALDNLRGGAAHLHALLLRFSGRQGLALAAYNAGEGAVLNAGSQIPAFEETRRYVPKVLAWRAHYQNLTDTPRSEGETPPLERASRNMTRLASTSHSTDPSRRP